MRVLAAVLIALATLAWSIPAAEARTRSDQTQAQGRSAGQQASRASATRRTTAPQRDARASRATQNRQAAAPSRTSRQASTRDARGTRNATARGGARQTAGAACRGRNCAAQQRRPVSWQAGLEPPTNIQANACPVGTMATLARGHSDIVRCMPL